jgi:hypothetical protein
VDNKITYFETELEDGTQVIYTPKLDRKPIIKDPSLDRILQLRREGKDPFTRIPEPYRTEIIESIDRKLQGKPMTPEEEIPMEQRKYADPS